MGFERFDAGTRLANARRVIASASQAVVASNARPLLACQGLSKTYQMGEVEVRALAGVDLELQPAELLVLLGASGSGKSTLLNILGCLDTPSYGTYVLGGVRVSDLDETQLALVRNQAIGFVFQNFNLLPRMSAVDQVEMPLIYRGAHNRRLLATEALRAVGLGDRLDHKPNELSGGQQQRVAIARALITAPTLVLADEPTGNLDSKTADRVFDLMLELNRELGTSLIVVTHDLRLAAKMDRTLTLDGGALVRAS